MNYTLQDAKGRRVTFVWPYNGQQYLPFIRCPSAAFEQRGAGTPAGHTLDAKSVEMLRVNDRAWLVFWHDQSGLYREQEYQECRSTS